MICIDSYLILIKFAEPLYIYYERYNYSRPCTNSQGFCHRPGSSLVPGMRRLFDPCPGSEGNAYIRYPQGKHRDHFRYRVFIQVSVLYEHVWNALDPWTCYRCGKRVKSSPARIERLDRYR